MDLEQAADELYAGTPEEFVGRRTALVKQARAEKDRALATAISGLRKPTRTAWLVNLLARAAPDDVGALLDLADALREAQSAQDGTTLRRLSGERRRAIDALTRRAAELAREHGHTPTETTTAEVASTLQAALGEPEVAEQVRLGRLASGAVYGGFGTPSGGDDAGGDLMAALAASMPGAAAPAAPPEDEVAVRRRQTLQRDRDEARSVLEEAQAQADEATERADDLAEQVDRLRAELEQAETDEREARTAARTAREDLRERRAAVDAAEQAWREAGGED